MVTSSKKNTSENVLNNSKWLKIDTLRGEKMKEEKVVTDNILYIINAMMVCLGFCTIKAKQYLRHGVFI